MAKMLKDTLKTIEKYKSMTPHYSELLDILGEILILREEYRYKMEDIIFSIDETLIEKKLSGGLPLIDLSSGACDLTEPKKYFLASLGLRKSAFPVKRRRLFKKLMRMRPISKK